MRSRALNLLTSTWEASKAFSSASSSAKSGTSCSTSGLHPIHHPLDAPRPAEFGARGAISLALLHDAQNLVLFQDQIIFPIQFDFRAGILPEQNAVARFLLGRHALAG